MLLLSHFTQSCSKCKELKIDLDFDKDLRNKRKITYVCRNCRNIKRRINREKTRVSDKAYRENNIEKYQCYHKKYYNKNIDKIKKYNETYYAENTDKRKKYQKKYSKTKIGLLSQKNAQHKRRSLKKQGDVTTNQLLELQKNAKFCYWCNASLKNKKVHIDHYIPLSKGGEHTISNLVVSCVTCNLKKNAKDPLEFANSIGKLL